MVIEPFNYQKRTNIEEHNQIVDKLNEVIDAVNNIDPNPSEFEQRIDALELSAINQQNAIEGIHTRDSLQDTAIQRAEDNVSQLERNVAGVNETVSGLTGQVRQLETDTTNLDGRVTDLNGRLTTLAGNQTALEGRVDSINTEVGQLSTEVGGLETGKVNVAQGTENAGKFLSIDDAGNVTPANVVSGEQWIQWATYEQDSWSENDISVSFRKEEALGNFDIKIKYEVFAKDIEGMGMLSMKPVGGSVLNSMQFEAYADGDIAWGISGYQSGLNVVHPSNLEAFRIVFYYMLVPRVGSSLQISVVTDGSLTLSKVSGQAYNKQAMTFVSSSTWQLESGYGYNSVLSFMIPTHVYLNGTETDNWTVTGIDSTNDGGCILRINIPNSTSADTVTVRAYRLPYLYY